MMDYKACGRLNTVTKIFSVSFTKRESLISYSLNLELPVTCFGQQICQK